MAGRSRDDARTASRRLAIAGITGITGKVGWVLVPASIGWALFLHYGLGPSPKPPTHGWYEPSGFLLRNDLLAPLFTSLLAAFSAFLFPSLLLAAGIFAGTRSAVARTLSLVCVVSAALFVFYGVVSPVPWKFFGWRGSAALWLTAACVGGALASPLLAASWLQLPRWIRAAVYLPIAFAVIALIRNATGTNEALAYALSPWPAVAIFGIEVGAMFVASALIGIAIATRGYCEESRPRPVRLLLAVLGLLFPLGIISSGAALGLFPFMLGAETLGCVAILCALCTALVLATRGGDSEIIRSRSRAMAAGAALIAVPLLAGQVLARIDYHVTREWRARSIIEALDRYAARETLYPDSLEHLVEAGDLAAIPKPAIGFRIFHDADFRYQSFGSSFILEFEAPRWVECAYTPPYVDDEDANADPDSSLSEAWSCPSEPPELW